MSDVVISVENLSKQYRLGTISRRTLSGDLSRWWARMRGRPDPCLRIGQEDLSKRHGETIWALKDVNFQVKRGEVLGIVGCNGAGKSTLLKILSRVTAPTSGRVKLMGRVGALLEVGTGFHPELTGRENVYLNGAILGMRREEVKRKFEEIVEFSGVEKFIDTPVKRYSSGMYVRLAFAVAAHLDPELLVLDEVLAVGDAAFQMKCNTAIRASTQRGSTALVVSHNMGLMRSLCTSAILLHKGTIAIESQPEDVIARYQLETRPSSTVYRSRTPPQGKPVRVTEALLRDADGNGVSDIPCGSTMRVELTISCESPRKILRPWIGVRIFSSDGELICHIANREAGYELPTIEGVSTVTCEVCSPNIVPGEYVLGYVLANVNNEEFDRCENALSFNVIAADMFGTGMITHRAPGKICMSSKWSVTSCYLTCYEESHEL